MKIELESIGVIHTPFTRPEGMPIQPPGGAGVTGSVEIFPEYVEGLKDLDGFSHIFLIYRLHEVKGAVLTVIPFMDDTPRGVFSTRSPKRPNAIGISVVKLNGVQGGQLEIENVDILDGTPLLDIKPYLPEVDHQPADRIGWLTGKKERFSGKKADDRFK
jgi:tRNA-Thr(GGU) m(6)t(6)A37 methyltransferase TsaA